MFLFCRQSTLSPNRVPTSAEKASKSGRRAVLRRLKVKEFELPNEIDNCRKKMKVRRKRPPTTAAPQFLNERELVEPQKSLVFQVNDHYKRLSPLSQENCKNRNHIRIGFWISETNPSFHHFCNDCQRAHPTLK